MPSSDLRMLGSDGAAHCSWQEQSALAAAQGAIQWHFVAQVA
jgi:hypothetical protein